MEKISLAYFAGIMDGEGYIHIASQKDRKNGNVLQRYSLIAGIQHSNFWLLYSFKSAFGGTIRSRVGYYSNATKEIWAWQISACKACYFLESILPYLRLKKAEAELAIEFQKAKVVGSQHKRLLEGKETVEEIQYWLMRELKREL